MFMFNDDNSLFCVIEFEYRRFSFVESAKLNDIGTVNRLILYNHIQLIGKDTFHNSFTYLFELLLYTTSKFYPISNNQVFYLVLDVYNMHMMMIMFLIKFTYFQQKS